MRDRPCFNVSWIVLPPGIAVEFEVVAVTSFFDEVGKIQVERSERTPTVALAGSGPEGPASYFRGCIEPAIEPVKWRLIVVGDTSEGRFWLRSNGGVTNAEHTPAETMVISHRCRRDITEELPTTTKSKTLRV